MPDKGGQGKRYSFVLPKDVQARFESAVDAETGGNCSRFIVQCIREHIEAGDDLTGRICDAVRDELSRSGVVRAADLQAVASRLLDAVESQPVDVYPGLPEAEREAVKKSARAEGYESGFKSARAEAARDLEALRVERDAARKESMEVADNARREEREKVAAMGFLQRRRYLGG